MTEMKACPLAQCGGQAQLIYAGMGGCYIECTNCGLTTRVILDDDDDAMNRAVRLWNSRSSRPTASADVVERVANELRQYRHSMSSVTLAEHILAIPRIHNALSASPVQEWQPIETAPRDGTRVLLYCGALGGFNVGLWVVSESEDGDWSNWVTHYDHEELPGPTHWMPLPEPPDATLAKVRDQ